MWTSDEIDIAHLMFKKLETLKTMMKKVENEEQEILQTKIVSPQEMVKEIDLWDEAIKSEMRSLLEEKKALKLLTSEERERSWRKDTEKSKRCQVNWLYRRKTKSEDCGSWQFHSKKGGGRPVCIRQ